jgi:hypothetical protein
MDGFIDNTLDKIKLPVYKTGMYLLHISYVFALFGIMYIDPNQINKLNIAVQLFVCIFLILRFHPFRTHELHKYDSQIIFGSALFLLANLGITQYVLSRVKSYVPIINQTI